MDKKTRKKLEEYILDNREHHYRMAYSYVGSQQDSLDIVQEAIYRALKYKGNIEIQYLGSWFCRILINCAKDNLKKQGRYVNLEDGITYPETNIEQLENDSLTEVEKKETSEELHKALSTLSENERDIITLRYFEEMDLKEVSQALEQNISTVKSTLYRALKKLRITLENQ